MVAKPTDSPVRKLQKRSHGMESEGSDGVQARFAENEQRLSSVEERATTNLSRLEASELAMVQATGVVTRRVDEVEVRLNQAVEDMKRWL